MEGSGVIFVFKSLYLWKRTEWEFHFALEGRKDEIEPRKRNER